MPPSDEDQARCGLEETAIEVASPDGEQGETNDQEGNPPIRVAQHESPATGNDSITDDDLQDNDVLLGRGGKNNRHVGNEQLRIMARDQVQRYIVSTKKVKSSISRELVLAVRGMNPPGRFLKRIPQSNGKWEDVGDDMAREKVSQVLRDAVYSATEKDKPSDETPEIELKMTASSSSNSIPLEDLHRQPISSLDFSGSIDTINIDTSLSQEALEPLDLGQTPTPTAAAAFSHRELPAITDRQGMQQHYRPQHPPSFPAYHQHPHGPAPPFYPSWGYRSWHGSPHYETQHARLPGAPWPVQPPYSYASYPPPHHHHPYYSENYGTTAEQVGFDRDYPGYQQPQLDTSPIYSSLREASPSQITTSTTPTQFSTPTQPVHGISSAAAQSGEASVSRTLQASPQQTRRTKRGRYQSLQVSTQHPLETSAAESLPRQHSPFVASSRPYADVAERSDYTPGPFPPQFASSVHARPPTTETSRSPPRIQQPLRHEQPIGVRPQYSRDYPSQTQHSPPSEPSPLETSHQRQTQQYPHSGAAFMVSSSSSSFPPQQHLQQPTQIRGAQMATSPSFSARPTDASTTFRRRVLRVNTASQMIVADNLTIVHQNAGTAPRDMSSAQDNAATRRRTWSTAGPREGTSGEFFDLLQGDLLFESSSEEGGSG